MLIPKEKDASDISQFRAICLLNVEGKIFVSVVLQRLSTYLVRNKYINTSVQKAGISGCLEHTSMIWHQIQAAKKDKKDLHVILDLANALGSVPQEILRESFAFFPTPATLKHIITGCKTSLTQGRYTWHNQVLKSLASAVRNKLCAANSLTQRTSNQPRRATFVQEGQKTPRHHSSRLPDCLHQPQARPGVLVHFTEDCVHHKAHRSLGELCGGGL